MMFRRSMATRQSLVAPIRRHFSGWNTPTPTSNVPFVLGGMGLAGVGFLCMRGM